MQLGPCFTAATLALSNNLFYPFSLHKGIWNNSCS